MSLFWKLESLQRLCDIVPRGLIQTLINFTPLLNFLGTYWAIASVNSKPDHPRRFPGGRVFAQLSLPGDGAFERETFSAVLKEKCIKEVPGWQFLIMKAAGTLCIVCLPPEEHIS